jgi:thiol-disulfide isomerase/thioredoxin
MKKLLIILLFLPLTLSFASEKSFKQNEYELAKFNGGNTSYNEMMLSSDKTILFFWTSWCYYCRKELKRINKNPIDDAQGAKIYYINIGEDFDTVGKVVKDYKLNDSIVEDMVLDLDSFFPKKFSIISIPTYIFLENGEVIHKTNVINERVIQKVFSNE